MRCGARAAAVVAALALPVGASGAQVTTLQPLSFGTVIAGTTTTVAPAAPGAARLRIRGILGLAGGFSLTLPATLRRVGGTETMPVTFCATCAVFRIGGASPVGGIVFDPAAPVSGLVVLVLSDINVWVGARVSPPPGQAPGSYTGTIVFTVSPLL